MAVTDLDSRPLAPALASREAPVRIGPGHPDWMALVDFDDRAETGGFADAWEDHRPRFLTPELRAVSAHPVPARLLQLDHGDAIERWWDAHPDGEDLLDAHRQETLAQDELAEYREYGWPSAGMSGGLSTSLDQP